MAPPEHKALRGLPLATRALKGWRRSLASKRGTAVRISSLALTLLIWEYYGRSVSPIFLSYPTAILASLPEMLKTGELQTAFLSSGKNLLFGLSLAIACGTLLGVLMGRYRFFDDLLELQISALYATPNVALIPLFMLWFGLGTLVKIVIVFLSAFFPIVVNTYHGVRNVSRSLVEVALAEGATEAQVIRKIILPASLPFVTTGVRLSIGRAIVGMVVGEMFTASSGLGGAIVTYGNAFATKKLFVVIILLALMGVLLTEAVRFVEQKLAPWKATERAT